MYAKHTVYYDALPHYFLEFDIFDRLTGIFLDTAARRKMLQGVPVVSVPVLGEGVFESKEEILSFLGQSRYVTAKQRQRLLETALKLGLNPEPRLAETEISGLMEGLYIKIEENGQTVDRMKFVRAAFLQCIDFTERNWIDKTIIPNRLAVPLESLFE